MFKRWAIRGVFLFLLLLCVGGWGWSVTHCDTVSYRGSWVIGECTTRNGVVELSCCKDSGLFVPDGFGYTSGELSGIFDVFSGYGYSRPRSYWGFAFDWQFTSSTGLWLWSMAIPYWFLTLVLVLSTLVVWRKTRPQLSSAMAFPIEITNGQP